VNHSDVITIVTGVPRSGTSMLMRMLGAGGVPLLVDDQRPPDDNNPHGYFEFTPVARTKSEADWVPTARGRAVKVVSYLVPYLPLGEDYRFIFMRRTMDEVLTSQDRMLGKVGPAPDDRFAEVFARQDLLAQAWIEAQCAPAIAVPFAQVHADPAKVAGEVAAFLGGGFDVAAMAAAVNPALYRNRAVDAQQAITTRHALHQGVSGS